MPSPLTDAELQAALPHLPHWSVQKDCLVKRFPFPTYMEGIRFVEGVAVDAEARDHHPDMLVRYQDVTVFLTTHLAGGITPKDLDSARAIDALAASLSPR